MLILGLNNKIKSKLIFFNSSLAVTYKVIRSFFNISLSSSKVLTILTEKDLNKNYNNVIYKIICLFQILYLIREEKWKSC
jgi:hypothetical protein